MTNKKAKGKRAKTRRKLSGGHRKTVSQLVKQFEEGKAVQVCIDPSTHSGIPSKKYHGFAGKVSGKRGQAFEVDVRDGKIARTLVVGPAHLKEMGGSK